MRPKTWREALDAFFAQLPRKTKGGLGYIPGAVVLDEPLFTDMDDPRFLHYIEGWVIAREDRGKVLKMWYL